MLVGLRRRKGGNIEDFNKRLIRKSLNVILLAQIRNRLMSGFDAIKSINKKFGVLVSAGTVYPILHSLKKNGILKSKKRGKSIVYEVKNKENIDRLLNLICNHAEY